MCSLVKRIIPFKIDFHCCCLTLCCENFSKIKLVCRLIVEAKSLSLRWKQNIAMTLYMAIIMEIDAGVEAGLNLQ